MTNCQNILVIDDDPFMLEFVSLLIAESLGNTVFTASNLAEIIDNLSGKVIHLIITDINMPQLNGFALIKKLREREQFHSTPVIYLTGDKPEDIELPYQDEFVLAILQKQPDPSVFAAQIEKLISINFT